MENELDVQHFVQLINIALSGGITVTANNRQEGGDHYVKRAIQPWDYITQNEMGYLEGCIVKYVSRYKDKNGLEDLLKARHYLEKLIEVVNERT